MKKMQHENGPTRKMHKERERAKFGKKCQIRVRLVHKCKTGRLLTESYTLVFLLLIF